MQTVKKSNLKSAFKYIFGVILILFAVVFIAFSFAPKQARSAFADVTLNGVSAKNTVSFATPMQNFTGGQAYEVDMTAGSAAMQIANKMVFTFVVDATVTGDGDPVRSNFLFDVGAELLGTASVATVNIIELRITGKAWDGTTVTNQSIVSAEPLPGLYRVTQLTYSITIPKFTFVQDPLFEISARTTSSVTATVDATLSSAQFLVFSYLELDEVQLTSTLFNNSLGINPTYTGEDLKNFVKVHSASVETGVFTFSTKTTSYNVASGDRRFFKKASVDRFGASAQGTNIESGQDARTNTNLVGIFPSLQINWHEDELTEGIPVYTPKDSGTYYLKFFANDSLGFPAGMSPVKVNYRGAEYIQKFVVGKRELRIDINNPILAVFSPTKDYDGTMDASMLFTPKKASGIAVSAAEWAKCNGASADYNNSVMKELLGATSGVVSLLSFAGSTFSPDERIGMKASVTVVVRITSVVSPAKNYEPVVGYMEGSPGQFTVPAGNKFERIAHGIPFEILPVSLMLGFDTNYTGEEVYGDKLTVNDFNFSSIVKFMSGTTGMPANYIPPDYLLVDVYQNYAIKIIRPNQQGQMDSLGVLGKTTIFIIPRIGTINDSGGITAFVDAEGTEYEAYGTGEALFYSSKPYYFYFEVHVQYPNSTREVESINGVFNILTESKSGTELVISTGQLKALRIQKRNVSVTVSNGIQLTKFYDGTTAVNGFSASQTNILAADLQYIMFVATADYVNANAGTNIPISYYFGIKTIDENTEYEWRSINRIASYNIDSGSIQGIGYGNIKQLALTVSFVNSIDEIYYRAYDEVAFVAVRVAKKDDTWKNLPGFEGGGKLPEDLYYINKDIGSQNYGTKGFVLESQLVNYIDSEKQCFIRVEIKGFLTGEGFWHNEVSGTEELRRFAENFVPHYLLSWYDSVRQDMIIEQTSASSSPTDYYRLELSTNYSVTNYIFVPADEGKTTIRIVSTSPNRDATFQMADIKIEIAESSVNGVSSYKAVYYIKKTAVSAIFGDLGLSEKVFNFTTYVLVSDLNGKSGYNYEISGLLSYLIIDKLDVSDEAVEVNFDARLFYNGLSRIEDLFSGGGNAIIQFTLHPEYSLLYSALTANGGKLSSTISLTNFIFSCQIPEHGHGASINILSQDVMNFTMSGQYYFVIIIPETTNYKGRTFIFEGDNGQRRALTISEKEVRVYVTYPIRVYMDNEISYEPANVKYIDTNMDYDTYMAQNHRFVIDDDGKLVPDGGSGYSVYLWDANDLTGATIKRHIIYVGLANGERIDPSNGIDAYATANIKLINNTDAANTHSNGVTTGGALKHNYYFNYVSAALIVLKREITFTINSTQTDAYTGEDINPQVTINEKINGLPVGIVVSKVLKMQTYENGVLTDKFLDSIKVKFEESEKVIKISEIIFDEDGNGGYRIIYYVKQSDLIAAYPSLSSVTATNISGILYVDISKLDAVGGLVYDFADRIGTQTVRDAGIYYLSVHVTPNSDNQNDFKDSLVKIAVKLTINAQELSFKSQSATPSKDYTGEAFAIGLLEEYFAAKTSGLIVKKEWGEVSLQVAQKVGGSTVPVDKVTDAGTYILTVHAVISELMVQKKNVYFNFVGYENQTECLITLTLTINKSSAIEFTPLINYGTEKNFVITADYAATEMAFGYKLSSMYDEKIGETMSVVMAVDNVFYSNMGAVNNLPALTERIAAVSYDTSLRREVRNAVADSDGRILPGKTKYILTAYINNAVSAEYNPNYISTEIEFEIVIKQTALVVKIEFNEGYGPRKIYGETTDELEANIWFSYSGWKNGENLSIPLSPVIDWNVGGRAINADSRANDVTEPYTIKSKDGVAPENYYFDHGTGLDFTVEKAEAWIRVYGHEENGNYLNWNTFTGQEQVPLIMRMTGDKQISENEVIGDKQITITLEGKFKGTYVDGMTIAESNINRIADDNFICFNAGEYVFSVSVEASQNYQAVAKKYYYFKITKAILNMVFVNVLDGLKDYSNGYYGSAWKTYDKVESYPYFTVQYRGFVGDDAKKIAYSNPQNIYHQNAASSSKGIADLGLINPYYRIFSHTGTVVMAMDVGFYDVWAVADDGVLGTSDNYEIVVPRESNGGNAAQLEIKSRLISIISSGKEVSKTYDSHTRIPSGAIDATHYAFSAVAGEPNSGLLAGDILSLGYGDASCFARKDVLDSAGNRSVITIMLYDVLIGNGNYRLHTDDLPRDNSGFQYVPLIGRINEASVNATWKDEAGKTFTGKTTVTYNAEARKVTAQLLGVRKDDGQFESVGFIMHYICNEEYNSTSAPINAQLYTVELTILDTNYNNAKISVFLEILRAHVDIIFGGDIVQTYGNILSGLSATARGVGNYALSLSDNILYYNSKGECGDKSSIYQADAGVYTAYVFYTQTINFFEREAEIPFTILRRDVNIDMVVKGQYMYTGVGVKIDASFEYSGKVYNVALAFRNGDGTDFSGTPFAAGDYLVRAANTETNFNIKNLTWIPFKIVAIDISIRAVSTTVKMYDNVTIELEAQSGKLVNNERVNGIFTTQPTFRLVHTSTGEIVNLSTAAFSVNLPKAGVYKIEIVGGTARNYNIINDKAFVGFLTVNSSELSTTVNALNSDSGEIRIEIEGSFSSNLQLKAQEVSISYSGINEMFAQYKQSNADFNYSILRAFNLSFTGDYSSGAGANTFNIKIYLPDYVDNTDQTDAEYYVLHFDKAGSPTLISAVRIADYLYFSSESLDYFCILSVGGEEEKNDAWILYLCISLGVVFLGVSILLVVKRAA